MGILLLKNILGLMWVKYVCKLMNEIVHDFAIFVVLGDFFGPLWLYFWCVNKKENMTQKRQKSDHNSIISLQIAINYY